MYLSFVLTHSLQAIPVMFVLQAGNGSLIAHAKFIPDFILHDTICMDASPSTDNGAHFMTLLHLQFNLVLVAEASR